MWLKMKNKISPYLLVAPILIVFTGIIIIPAIEGFRISLTDWDGVYSIPNFIGFDNYKKFLMDDGFYKSLWVTLRFAVVIIVVQNGLSIFLAIMLSKDRVINSIARSVFFIPTLLTMIVIGLIFSYIFSPTFGPINQLAKSLGLDAVANIDWFGNVNFAFITIVVASVWQGLGYSMIIYIGGLKNIPSDYYESAYIDGVTPWKKFRYITFPLLAPAVTVNMLMSVINGLKIFDIPFAMTQGGPADATKTVAIMLYKDAFYGRSAGYAAAESFVLLILVFVISALQTRYFRSKEVNY
ncbi:carbohydrate ABC transporter permease [Diplocloster modestus]|uniref:Sugar ABC transporter permease n=1 Tax=Diplocloster modestus TaxID=2850322 RepID=A0ABS6K6V6_9FIRM|nr:sugar ABC transporter permease [Diplocloster modestus]MBU9726255.1 sugar ABC transporter permease [Diplocloster modestus]